MPRPGPRCAPAALVLAMPMLASQPMAQAQAQIGREPDDPAETQRPASSAAGEASPGFGDSGGGGGLGSMAPSRTMAVHRYLEVAQSVFVPVHPADTAVTYTTFALGGDARISGARTRITVAARFEQRISEPGPAGHGHTLSGLVRASQRLVGRALTLEAGGFASAVTVVGSGSGSASASTSALDTPLSPVDQTSHLWSLYAGPHLAQTVGRVKIDARYLVGWSELDSALGHQLQSAGASSGTRVGGINLFNHALTQLGEASAMVRPGVLAPFGITLNAARAQEDLGVLDQRLVDKLAGVRVLLPVARDLALVGDIGWEQATVSARPAVQGSNGQPVIGSNGLPVTNVAAARQLAYDVAGLTGDAGVVWRPSSRTELTAFVGTRYRTLSGFGTFRWHPDARDRLDITVYDRLSGFGSGLTNALTTIPDDAELQLGPVSGAVAGCGYGAEGGGCVTGALGSLIATIAHTRGITANYSHVVAGTRLGVGAGYVHRGDIVPPVSGLGVVNGASDETFYVNVGLSGSIDRLTGYALAAYENWNRSSLAGTGSASGQAGTTDGFGVAGALSRRLAAQFNAIAALGLDGVHHKGTSSGAGAGSASGAAATGTTVLDATGRVALRLGF